MTRGCQGSRMGDKHVIMRAARFGSYRRIAILAAVSFATGYGMFASPASSQSLDDRYQSLPDDGVDVGGRQRPVCLGCRGSGLPGAAGRGRRFLHLLYRLRSAGAETGAKAESREEEVDGGNPSSPSPGGAPPGEG